jgi:uncharacterized membrane-anchored protein
MIDWKKYSKEDRKFLINLSVQNRNYLASVSSILLAMVVGMSGFAVALYSLFVSLNLISQKTANIALIIIVLGMWAHWFIVHIKGVGHMKNLNIQYQEIHKTLHPELFKKGAGYFY